MALIVARMSSSERYKGHDALLDVWPRVIAHHPDAVLAIAGDGDDRAVSKRNRATCTWSIRHVRWPSGRRRARRAVRAMPVLRHAEPRRRLRPGLSRSHARGQAVHWREQARRRRSSKTARPVSWSNLAIRMTCLPQSCACTTSRTPARNSALPGATGFSANSRIATSGRGSRACYERPWPQRVSRRRLRRSGAGRQLLRPWKKNGSGGSSTSRVSNEGD